MPKEAGGGLTEYELALQVRDARQRHRDLQLEKEKLRTLRDIKVHEVKELNEKHELIYKRLQDVRGRDELKILRASQECNDPVLLEKLMHLVESRNAEDEVTAANLQSELADMRQEAERASMALKEQRLKTLNTIQALSRDWKLMEAEARRQKSETLRLSQETIELEARTTKASLEHAQQLFRGFPSTY